MAGLTATFDAAPDGKTFEGAYQVRRGYFTFDSSYAVGGETGAGGTLKSNLQLKNVVDLRVDRYGDYTFQWDKSNDKVKAFWNRLGVAVSPTITFTDDDNAASTGVAVYIHRDEVSEQGTALGHFECVNAGNADSYFKTATGGAKCMIQDDDNAASGGFAVFINEDDTAGYKLTADLDLISGTDTSASILVPCEDGTYIRVFDQDNPGGESGTVQLYFDDDAATDTARLLYVSPTDANSTDRLWAAGGEVPSGTDLSAVTPRFAAKGK